MKNVSLKIIEFTLLVLLVLSGISNVRAASSVVTLTASSDVRLKAGQTIIISVNIENGYEGFSGNVEYDTSVFESVTMTKSGNWNADLTNNIAVIDRPTAASGTEAVATLTLKVKDTISIKNTLVKITGVKASKDGATVSANNATIEIKADEKANSGNEEQNTPVANNEKQNTPVNTAKNQIKSSKTTAKRILNAGDTTTIIIASVVAIVAIVGCLGFIKYAKNKDIK